jgi:hypothetical protein
VHLCTITSKSVKLDVNATQRSRNLQMICNRYMPQCGLHDEVRLFLAETGAEISINPANSQHETPEFKEAWSFLRLKMLEAALKQERCSQLGSNEQPELTVVHVQVSTYSDFHFTLGRINTSKDWNLHDFNGLPEKKRDNFCVARASIKRDGKTYAYVNDHLLNNRKLALLAVTTDASNLLWVPRHFLTDPEIVLAAMKHGRCGRSVHEIFKRFIRNKDQQQVKDIVLSAGILDDEVGT